jgi:hypothetical protein
MLSKTKKRFLIENTIKNTILIVFLTVFYFILENSFSKIDSIHYDSVLMVVTIIIMASLFADYAFSYTGLNIKSKIQRDFEHLITFIIMFITGLCLEVVVIVMNFKIGGNHWFFPMISILFYISLVLYDFWDLLRYHSQK